MKKILFVLSRIPWPVDSGMKVVLSNWFHILNTRFNSQIYLFFVNQENNQDNRNLIPSIISGYSFGSKLSGKRKLINIFTKSLFGNWPLQSSIYYDKENYNLLSKYVDQVKPDIIIYDMVRTMNYIGIESKATKIMYLQDMLSDRYKLQYATKKYDNIFGESKESGFLAKLSKRKILSKCALKYESKKVYKAEIRCAKTFDKIALISDKENRTLRNRAKTDNIYTIPMGIDYIYFSQAQNNIDNNILTFVGNMNYAPNHASVVDICDKLLPNIKSDIHFNFIGPVPEDLVLNYKNNNRVTFLGKVDDLRKEVGNSVLVVAPISFGSGIKSKIVEGFAMGKCIVTNSVGAENIDAINGTHFFVENDFKKMGQLIDSLLLDKDKIVEVGNSAKKLAEEKYSQAVVEKAMQVVFFEE